MNSTILIACTSKFSTIHWAEKLHNAQYITHTCHTNLADALMMVAQHSPNLLLAEATFATNGGFDLARQAMMRQPALRCAVFVPAGMEFWEQAIQTDVSGYLSDPLVDGAELLHCLSEIRQRRRYISPVLRHLALMPSPNLLSVVQNLKPRHKQILKLLAHGLTARQISIELKITEATVRTHKENLVTVLGLHSAAELKGFAGSVLGWLE